MIEKLNNLLRLGDLGPSAVLDILLLALIIFQLLKLVRGTRSVPSTNRR